ncbi:fimbria/pilus outer membrane usher protein [Chromobacterium sphagni]|uniref:fimbria/pilus outer membrane usher protein n=1 Tax=Chromobacterium sphagni TaxID=1903179 RepID=UPI00111372F4|nr:fimbria/pilus outer membrane usher protein [Chromobacterium sphagni]
MKKPQQQRDELQTPDLARLVGLLWLAVCGGKPAWAADAVTVQTPAAPPATQPAPAGQAVAPPAAAAPQDLSFNPAFFGKTSEGLTVDLSRFNRGDVTTPGVYRADVYVNQAWLGRRDVVLRETKGKVLPCVDRGMLEQLGVDSVRLAAAAAQNATDGACVDVATVVPGSQVGFDMSEQRLDVTIPQLYLRASARGYVDPQYWDAGMPLAGFLSYNANAYRYRNDGSNSSQYFVSTNTGVNVSGWRLRYNGSLAVQDSGGVGGYHRNYASNGTYAQHDLTDWKAQLTVGDTFTPSDLLSSVPFRGVLINSDDRMLPESLQGYAPIVRGVAETNAKVSVSQNGKIIYEGMVPPGEFKIDDLYNTGYAGDMVVTVTEADGRTKQFIMPYAAVPQLLRQGSYRFSLLAGQLQDGRLSSLPDFVQGSYQSGLTNNLSLYGATVLADHYQELMLGTAFNTIVGAFSTDITQSVASDLSTSVAPSRDMSGRSYRINYSKILPGIRTNFSVASYFYSTEGYLGLTDFAGLHSGFAATLRPRRSLQLNVDQPLSERLGRVFLSGSAQSYWSQSSSQILFQGGYSNSFKWGGFSLSAGRTRNGEGQTVTQYLLSVNLLLGKSPYSPQLASTTTVDSQHNQNEQLSISGTTGEQHNLSYNAYASYQDNKGSGSTTGGGASVQYANSVATLNASASSQGSNRQEGAGISGALVFHPGGVVAAQSLGDSIGLVQADGAEGAILSNANGVSVNRGGYAVLPNLVPYRVNEVTLDPKGMSDAVELQTTSAEVVPRAGAIVLLKFPTQKGRPVLVSILPEGGAAIPVGSAILDEKGGLVAMVGQGGRAFLRGLDGQNLIVRWGAGSTRECQFRYQLPVQIPDKGFVQLRAQCQPLATVAGDKANDKAGGGN